MTRQESCAKKLPSSGDRLCLTVIFSSLDLDRDLIITIQQDQVYTAVPGIAELMHFAIVGAGENPAHQFLHAFGVKLVDSVKVFGEFVLENLPPEPSRSECRSSAGYRSRSRRAHRCTDRHSPPRTTIRIARIPKRQEGRLRSPRNALPVKPLVALLINQRRPLQIRMGLSIKACQTSLGLIRLAGQCSSSRMEPAAERALVTGTCRYQVRLKLCWPRRHRPWAGGNIACSSRDMTEHAKS